MSPVLVSNDGIPRMYISVPIFSESSFQVEDSGDKTSQSESVEKSKNFEGAVVASIETKTLGRYLENQIHPNFPGGLTLVDRNVTSYILKTKH